VKSASVLAKENGKRVKYDLLLKLIDMRTEFKKSVEGAAADDAMNAYH
jgi:hypothetical protein